MQALEQMGYISGVVDDRGKFIYIEQREMEAMAQFVKKKVRVRVRVRLGLAQTSTLTLTLTLTPALSLTLTLTLKGRVRISVLAQESSNLIDLEPKFVADDEAEEEAAEEETATGR